MEKLKTVYRQKIYAKKVSEDSFPWPAKLLTSSEAFSAAWTLWDHDQILLCEHFNVLFLSRSNTPICWAEISRGGVSGTVVDIRIIAIHAIKCGASNVIMYHNHPSGNTSPSTADRDLTTKCKAGLKLLDVNLLDHIILSPENTFYSFADEGLL